MKTRQKSNDLRSEVNRFEATSPAMDTKRKIVCNLFWPFLSSLLKGLAGRVCQETELLKRSGTHKCRACLC